MRKRFLFVIVSLVMLFGATMSLGAAEYRVDEDIRVWARDDGTIVVGVVNTAPGELVCPAEFPPYQLFCCKWMVLVNLLIGSNHVICEQQLVCLRIEEVAIISCINCGASHERRMTTKAGCGAACSVLVWAMEFIDCGYEK